MKHQKYLAIFALILITSLTACSGGELTISDPWTRPALAGGNGAAYLVIQNGTGSDDVLLSASTDAASVVELHDVVQMDTSGTDSGDMSNSSDMAGGDMAMQMVKQENVPVPAGETVTFKPGSYHVMMIGLTSDLTEGDSITLTLVFQNAGEVTIEVPVESR